MDTKCWGNIPLIPIKAKVTKTILFVQRETLRVSMPRRLDSGLDYKSVATRIPKCPLL